jgi:hypothetical protein
MFYLYIGIIFKNPFLADDSSIPTILVYPWFYITGLEEFSLCLKLFWVITGGILVFDP